LARQIADASLLLAAPAPESLPARCGKLEAMLKMIIDSAEGTGCGR
jgi:hypothetical protein